MSGLLPFLWTGEKGMWRIADRIREYLLRRGYTCDDCGAELFDYPAHRLCQKCEAALKIPQRPCPKCGRERVADGLCLNCKVALPKFTRGFSPFLYKGEAAGLVNRMKNGAPRLAAYLGERMAEVFFSAYEGGDPLLVVAVPVTKEKRREHGYNQSERLAESVCRRLKELGMSAVTDFAVLEKRRETAPQKQMTRRERTENVQGAFHVHKRKACEGRAILLVDDILTTGTTGSECAERLIKAGAKSVYFLTAVAVPEKT